MIDSDKQALLNNTCTIPIRLTFTINGEQHVIRENNIIDINYEDYRYVDTQSLVVGQFVARKITGSISTLDYNINVEDTEFKVEMGIQKNESDNLNWYSLGNFLITKPNNNDVKDIINFEALDYTKKFNVEFDPSNVTYPCTALELAEAVCEQCGVGLGNDDFTNYDFIIPNNQYAEKESCRKVMQDIGKLAFSWVRIGWDNKCYIDFSIDNTIDRYNEITTDKYYELEQQYNTFGPVNRIVVGMSNVEGENVVIEDSESIEEYGVTELQIYDNNITYTPELRQACIDGGRKLFGLSYVPLNITTVGHPWLIGNEKIKITDTKNNIIYTYPFNRTISYMGHIKTKLESKAETKTETEYRNTDTLETEVKKTRIIVNKQEGEISELASKIVDVSSEKTGIGIVMLENAHKGILHKLSISGNMTLLYPSNTLYPKDDFYMLSSKIKIDNTIYELDINYLNYLNENIYDEFIYEDGKCNIIRRVGINNGEKYALQTEIIEPRKDIILNVDTNSNIRMLSFPNLKLKVEYLLENKYTDTFASQVEVNAEIKTTADSINLEVSKKVDANEIISKINQTPEQISINANKIKLEGYTTINNGFSIDENGNASMHKARITGGRLLLDPGETTANLKIGEAEFFEDIIILRGSDSYQKDSQGHDLLLYETTIQRPTYNGSRQGIISLTSGQKEDASLVCDKDGSHVFLRHDNNVIWLDTNYAGYNNNPYMIITDGTNTTSLSATAVWSHAFNNVSTEDVKKNIKLYNKSCLDIIKNTDVYDFNYKGETNNTKKHIGVVIGDEYKCAKEIIADDKKGIDLYAMVSVCFKAIQEQQEQIDTLKKEIEKLKEEK